MKFSTKSIHVGQPHDPVTWAIIPPLYLTSTYVQKEPWKAPYEYTRSHNPNFDNVEETLASLEEGKFWLLHNSWLWAMSTIILWLLESGDSIVSIDDVYWGTFRLFNNIFDKFGIWFTKVDVTDEHLLREMLEEKKPKMLRIESPTNPLLKTCNLETIAAIWHEFWCIVVVDNTFATPYFQKPLTMWADLVVHSTTKYLNGHSDLVWWCSVTNNEEIYKKLRYHRNAAWTNPNPFDAWLLSRSLKTLEVRMERHDANAKKVVSFLESHALVEKIYYPWFWWMVSIEFDLDLEEMKKLIASFTLFRLAESLWWVESMVDHPATMTHASIPKEEREAWWLKDWLVRFSVWIEDSVDLIEDLRQWLATFA